MVRVSKLPSKTAEPKIPTACVSNDSFVRPSLMLRENELSVLSSHFHFTRRRNRAACTSSQEHETLPYGGNARWCLETASGRRHVREVEEVPLEGGFASSYKTRRQIE